MSELAKGLPMAAPTAARMHASDGSASDNPGALLAEQVSAHFQRQPLERMMPATRPVYLPSMAAPPRLRAALMKLADEHCHSLTAEIRYALIEYVRRADAEQPAGKAA